MGGALLRAWLDRGYDPRKISVIEPRPSLELVALARAKGFALGPPSRPPQVLVLARLRPDEGLRFAGQGRVLRQQPIPPRAPIAV